MAYERDMLDGYEDCALWADAPTDENGTESDFVGVSDQAREQFREDVNAFYDANEADLADMDPVQAGHDFWLTRNRHGTGFWDRGLGALGDRLTAAAHIYGSCDLYVGDDGMLYAS